MFSVPLLQTCATFPVYRYRVATLATTSVFVDLPIPYPAALSTANARYTLSKVYLHNIYIN